MNNDAEIELVQQKIQYALNKQPTKGSIINAYCHMWGYFKKISTEQEKQLFIKLKTDFESRIITENELIDFIKKLADLYEVTYLKQSTIINKAHLNE
ncbi:YbgA family protein [Staphylococcus xylosus]|nr:YbgA family protein [Staphylococcus xylosus]